MLASAARESAVLHNHRGRGERQPPCAAPEMAAVPRRSWAAALQRGPGAVPEAALRPHCAGEAGLCKAYMLPGRMRSNAGGPTTIPPSADSRLQKTMPALFWHMKQRPDRAVLVIRDELKAQ